MSRVERQGPFSGLIRILFLRAARRRAEAPA
jgi:hypothetical protein